MESDKNAAGQTAGFDNERDELFEDAVRLVMDTGQASSSMLQRKFRIGYTRAARLVDCMEDLALSATLPAVNRANLLCLKP